MTNHLYEHGKPLRHVLIYSNVIIKNDINMTNNLYEHGKPLRNVLIYSDVILS